MILDTDTDTNRAATYEVLRETDPRPLADGPFELLTDDERGRGRVIVVSLQEGRAWTYCWPRRNRGCPHLTLTEWLAGCDIGYVAGKMGAASWFDAEKIERHHYSASYVAARLRVGLYRSRSEWFTPELVGVAVFSVPQQPAALECWTGSPDGVELGRFVLLDDVPGNGETWFLARAFRVLRSELPDVRTVLSYSDPMPRSAVDGRLVTPGHIGTIYQAHNGRHVGRTRPDYLHLDRDGRTVSRRGLSKLRNGERGAAAVYRRLLDAGAPERLPLEDDAAYVERALREGPFRRVRHPGNIAYAWPVDPAAAEDLPPALTYPRRAA